jgi:hypothetical protein
VLPVPVNNASVATVEVAVPNVHADSGLHLSRRSSAPTS